MGEPTTVAEAERQLNSLTARVEKRVLVWMAERLPAWINSDHLTLLGLLALVLAGGCYAAVRTDRYFLHGVNACLVLNWFGDSLDGTLARVRRKLRPRYGFYVDHLVDALGALFLLAGLGASGLVRPWIAAALLIAYFLLTINIAYATYALGVFKIAYGRIGGTELRILLALVNHFVFAWPEASVFGERVFDVVGALGTVAITFTMLRSAAQVTRTLYERERL